MFGLRPNVDGHVLPHDLPDMIAAHEANGAALLIGSNYDEGTELLPRDDARGPRGLARRRFGAEGDAIAKLYNGADNESATVAQDRILSRLRVRRVDARSADFRGAGRAGVCLSLYPLRPGIGADQGRRVPFGAELVYVFGTQARSIGRGPIATGNCPTRCKLSGRISLRPGIRTALVCRSGRATGSQRKT